ncbi:MAG: hypothetical protein KDJ28_08040 [Candidatus Competibacteraceae bacterium]|nr:hypothetical protein [Candidatus Competibacteraceae bacterium]
MMINTAINMGAGSIKGAIKSTDGSVQRIARETVHPLASASAAAPVGDRRTQTTASAPQQDLWEEPALEQEAALYRAQGSARIVSASNAVGQVIDTFV